MLITFLNRADNVKYALQLPGDSEMNSDKEKIKVQFSEENVGMAVSVDGQIHIPIDYSHQVYIERSEFDALLVRLTTNDYYSTLRSKMGWSGNFR